MNLLDIILFIIIISLGFLTLPVMFWLTTAFFTAIVYPFVITFDIVVSVLPKKWQVWLKKEFDTSRDPVRKYMNEYYQGRKKYPIS